MKKKKGNSYKMSYESDGKMGKDKKENNQKREPLFFNNTPDSE